MTIRDQLDHLLKSAARAGETESLLAELVSALAAKPLATVDTSEARVDLDRARRCGYPEVIYGPGKPVEALVDIAAAQLAAEEDVLVTRVTPEQAHALTVRWAHGTWNSLARTVRIHASPERPTRGQVAVVTAGTSDRPVAEEVLETLRWIGAGTDLLTDVGVAGPWRLLEHLPRLRKADAVVVVAGMEGALPSVVGGWVAVPVFAVPTSVGYGAAAGGIAALLGMLNSCAANVAVVNIDAGFKAGYLAGMVARKTAAE